MGQRFSSMRTWLAAAILWGGSLAIGGASAQAVELQTYGGEFAADFPGVPSLSRETIQTPLGPITVETVVLETGETAFVVVHYDLPAEHVRKMGAAQILDSSRNGAVFRVRGRLLAEVKTSLADFPGRQMLVAVENSDQHIAARIFLVGNRVYQIWATGSIEQLRSPVYRRFFESFTLTPKAKLPSEDYRDDAHYATPDE